MKTTTDPKRAVKRDLFAELSEGMEALLIYLVKRYPDTVQRLATI